MRSLINTSEIAIKPVTVLVGANSSGKSTFLRFFPLLKQSLEKKTQGPLLWYGRMVDYGSFKESLNHDSEVMEIGFEFDFPRENRMSYFRTYLPQEGQFSICISISQDSSSQFENICNVKVTWEDFKAEIQAAKDGKIEKILINGTPESTDLVASYLYNTGNILPELVGKFSEKSQLQYLTSRYALTLNSIVGDRLVKFSHGAQLFHIKTSDDKRREILSRLTLDTSAKTRDRLVALGKSSENKGLQKAAEFLSDINIQTLRKLVFLSKLPELMACANRQLAHVGNSVVYIAPLRASFERYYRVQNVSIDVVDPDGANLAMFLNGFSTTDLDNFNTYLARSFGVTLKVERTAGHVSLKARSPSSRDWVNLADIGFGISQILPILVQIWAALKKKPNQTNASDVLLAIEQPELHLHPRYQASFASLIENLLSDAENSNVRFVIETHSETIINHFGNSIANNKAKADDYQIVLFDSTPEGSHVKVATYDEKGYLKQWPVGFFDA